MRVNILAEPHNSADVAVYTELAPAILFPEPILINMLRYSNMDGRLRGFTQRDESRGVSLAEMWGVWEGGVPRSPCDDYIDSSGIRSSPSGMMYFF